LRTDHTFLDNQRKIADHRADQLVKSYFSKQQTEVLYEALRMPFAELRQKDNPVTQFLKQPKALPTWYNDGQVLRGQEFFKEYAAEIMMLLGVQALPYCYAGSPGNKALYLSDKMRNQPGKRLFDTGEFVLAVSQPGNLSEGAIGLYQINKTRLIHAIARYYILQGAWDDAWGAPINQEDMAGTNLAFSYIILNGLRMSGHKLTEAQKDDFIHLWRYIGYQLGIDEDLLPAHYQEAFLLTKRIRKRNFRYSEEGEVLTRELLNYYKKVAPPEQARVIASQVRYYLGDKVSDYLGIPQNPLKDRFTSLFNNYQELTTQLSVHQSTYEEMLRQYRSFQPVD